ncbi:MAG: hypothetical protein AAFZ80_05010 [Cyanobacteria bacterium P01_A01_bin.105]
MGKLTQSLVGAAALLAATVAATQPATAQEILLAEPTVLDTVTDITYNHSGDYYRNRSLTRQVDILFGPGWLGGAAFPELEMDRDAEALETAYGELMFLQTRNTPTVRVPDLSNPYTTSVQLLPLSQSGSRVVGSELNFEPLPRR